MAKLLRDGIDARDAARVEGLAVAIRDHRVGGSFWDPPLMHGLTGHVLLCPGSWDEACIMADQIGEFGDRPMLAVLPAVVWAEKAAARLGAGHRVDCHIGSFDPWTCLSGVHLVVAGWTHDQVPLAMAADIPVRLIGDAPLPDMSCRSRSALLCATLLHSARYRDPFHGTEASAEDVVDLLALWRKQIDANRQIGAACGIAAWKRREAESFFWAGRRKPLCFTRSTATALREARRGARAVAVWPSRAPRGLFEQAGAQNVPLYQVEDGFIRSVGLGSGLHPPLSLVLDRQGIYYDPTQPSDLEMILQDGRFSSVLLDRARRLIAAIVDRGISKYGGAGSAVPEISGNRRSVLVPGQVEDDRSVRLGGSGVRGNLDLLLRVRAEEPDAYILYKPHPDVEAGHRPGKVPSTEILKVADDIVRDAPMPSLLKVVDAVHVWTSLTGFEALLRGREVTTHGSPFFAGWGLTRDLGHALPRRTRRLTLEELVAGTLILYPRYLDPVTRMPCPPEVLVARMSEQVEERRTWLTEIRRLQGRFRRTMSDAFA